MFRTDSLVGKETWLTKVLLWVTLILQWGILMACLCRGQAEHVRSVLWGSAEKA